MTSVVCDFDGTLIDSSPGILLSIQSAILSCHLPLTALETSLIGPPICSVFRSLYPDLHDSILADLVSSFQAFYDSKYFSLVNPYPNVYAVLSFLRNKNIRLFVVTNKRAKPTFALLKSLGWQDLFDRVLCLDMLNDPLASKSDVLSLLLSECSLVPSSTPYLGDRYDDYLAANINCMPFLFAEWGYGFTTDFSHNDKFVSLSDLSLLPYLNVFNLFNN